MFNSSLLMAGAADPLTIFGSRLKFWADLSDVSTLFQNSTGTTPVAALNDPIGGVLDKSKGLMLGSELVSNGDFSNGSTGWTLGANWSVSGGAAVATTTPGLLSQTISITAGNTYKVSFSVAGNVLSLRMRLGGSTNLINTNLADGTYTYYLVAESGNSLISFTCATGGSATVDNISIKLLPGNHATQGTSASRPLWKQDGNGCFNALFDGTDDSWATAAIDLSASDKVTIFTAARKRSDAARGIMYEFSPDINSNNGSFALEAPDTGAANTLRPRSKGTALATISIGSQVAPIGVVLAHVCDIAGDLTALYINGVLAGSSPTDQGSGNFGNYAHYIGRRGGASLPAAVDIYQHAIVQGIASAAEIAAMTAFFNSKSRLF